VIYDFVSCDLNRIACVDSVVEGLPRHCYVPKPMY
jgi:hypothetical protein